MIKCKSIFKFKNKKWLLKLHIQYFIFIFLHILNYLAIYCIRNRLDKSSLYLIACNAVCRTCQISNDFSTGTSDYCTSCDANTLPILDLGASKPTCVADLPASRAMVIIQNNQILGVNNDATKYGGQTSSGTKTTQAQSDPNANLQSSSTPPSTSSTSNASGGINSSSAQSNSQVLLSKHSY